MSQDLTTTPARPNYHPDVDLKIRVNTMMLVCMISFVLPFIIVHASDGIVSLVTIYCLFESFIFVASLVRCRISLVSPVAVGRRTAPDPDWRWWKAV